MENLIKNIKTMAHNVSEGYLVFNKPINEQIYEMRESGEITNSEILKRVCELVNQNVYLSLFHDSEVDNSNIHFDYADYEAIEEDVQDTEAKMGLYDTPLDDFRMGLHSMADHIEHRAELNPELIKIAALHEANRLRDGVNNITSLMGMIEADSVKIAEQSYVNMKNDAKNMMYYGRDTIDDMSKIACNYLSDMDYGMDKVASAYSLIRDELKENGNIVHEGLTKMASEPFDSDNEFFEPIEKLATSIMVADAAKEFSQNISYVKSQLDEIIHG